MYSDDFVGACFNRRYGMAQHCCTLRFPRRLLKFSEFPEVIRSLEPLQVGHVIFLKSLKAERTTQFEYHVATIAAGESAAVLDVLSAHDAVRSVVAIAYGVFNAHVWSESVSFFALYTTAVKRNSSECYFRHTSHKKNSPEVANKFSFFGAPQNPALASYRGAANHQFAFM